MIDLSALNVGDRVEYQPSICSESLRETREAGIYQSPVFWSPDERPMEVWLTLIGQGPRTRGLEIVVRLSQITRVLGALEA